MGNGFFRFKFKETCRGKFAVSGVAFSLVLCCILLEKESLFSCFIYCNGNEVSHLFHGDHISMVFVIIITKKNPHTVWHEKQNPQPWHDLFPARFGTMAHKGHAANKKRLLQTKKMRCKQKTIAANKKHALQTKNDRCKQKTMRCKQKTLWLYGRYKPVKVFKILNGRQSGILNKLH